MPTETLIINRKAAAPAETSRSLLTLYVAATIVLADMYLTQPVLPLLSKEFGIPPASAGLSVSAVVLMIALASLASGPLSDAFGRRRIMVASSALLVVPTLLCAFAPTYPLLLLFRALQGLCIPGLTAVAVAYIGDQVEPGELGRAVGGWIAANVVGGLVGRLSSGIITDFFGWRAVFLCYGVLTLLGAVMLWMWLSAETRPAQSNWRQAYRGLFGHLRNRRLIGAFLIGGALFFGFTGIFTYLPYYLTGQPFNLSPQIVAFAYLSYLAGVIASPLAGRLSARFSRRRLMGIGLCVAIIGVLLTLIQSLPVIVASLFVLCSGMFTAQAVAPAFVNAEAPQAKGSAGALYLVSYYLGGTLGAALPGLAWQAVGWTGVVLIAIVAMTIALLSDWLLCA